MSPDEREVALGSLSIALDGLLGALVALDGVGAVEVPVDALDAALHHDEARREARVAFSETLDELRDVLGEAHLGLVLRVEERATELCVAAADVSFRLGLTIAATNARRTPTCR